MLKSLRGLPRAPRTRLIHDQLIVPRGLHPSSCEFRSKDDLSKFSWVNQSGATAAIVRGRLKMVCPGPGGGNNQRMFLTTPPTAPYYATARVSGHGYVNYQMASLTAYNVGNGGSYHFGYGPGVGGTIRRINFSGINDAGGTTGFTNVKWPLTLMIVNDGTNLAFWHSYDDGESFLLNNSFTLASYLLTTTGIGFAVDGIGATVPFDSYFSYLRFRSGTPPADFYEGGYRRVIDTDAV